MKKSLSFWIIILLIIITGWYGKNLKRWEKNEIINNDVTQYYAYFPATIIYNDWTFNFRQDLPKDFEGRIWLSPTPEGKDVLKMTMGLSILWLPFEAVAHQYARHSHFRADGYTQPYSVAIFISALFYLFLGLFYLRKILLKYFSETATALIIILLVIATNMMHYIIAEPGMSHVYNFCLITAFLYLSIQWLEKPDLKHSVLIGLVCGLIALIRPVNVVVAFIPLLWQVTSVKALQNRFKLIWEKKWLLLLAVFMAFLVITPQLAYWKEATGHWVYYSYGDEGFFFTHPHIIDGLFSYRKGWFVYTPIMFLATIGFVFLPKFIKGVTASLILTMFAAIYVVFSWWCWWYGGSFGARPLIDFYGVMALPLAAFIQQILKSKIWLKTFASLLCAFFIYLNLFQMNQYRTSLLHWDSMTKEAYWGIMLKKNWPDGYDKMIKTPDYDNALKGLKEYSSQE